MTEITEVYEAIEAKWNLLSECLPHEDGCYVVTTEDRKFGICVFTNGVWYTVASDNKTIIEMQKKIIKWYSISIPDPDEGEK